jgi:Tfp pilus assembly protein PilO
MSKEQTPQNILRRYPLAVASTGVALALLVVVAVRYSGLDEANAALEQNTTEAQKAERNVRNAADLEQHLAIVNQGVARLEKMLIGVDDVSGNQAYFYRLETETGVRVSVLRPTGASKDQPKNASYQRVGFNVVVQGSYAQVIAFLRALEQGDRLYRLVDFSLQRASEDRSTGTGAGVALNLNLQLLARK